MAKHKYIETPELLWDYFLQYVQHEADRPLYKREYVGKDGNEVDTPLQVPITFEGFECWLGNQDIIDDLGHYSSNLDNAYDAYLPIITRIRKNCFVQNFKGASVGLFNSNLIARKLGITEKSEQTQNVTHTIKGLEIMQISNKDTPKLESDDSTITE